MPRKYSVTQVTAAIAAGKAQVGVTGTAAVRPALWEVEISSVATPADQATEWYFGRFTAWTAPTSTSQAAVALDDSDPSPTGVGFKLVTDATMTLVINVDVAVNLRATYRWIAAPDEYVIAGAATTKGLHVTPSSQTSAYNVSTSIVYME